MLQGEVSVRCEHIHQKQGRLGAPGRTRIKRSLGKVGAENQVNCVDPGALRNCVNRVSLRGAGIAWEDFRFFEFFFEEL